MRYRFLCNCGKDITKTCTYSNQDGYFYINGYCEKCEEEDSVDLTDWLENEEESDWD